MDQLSLPELREKYFEYEKKIVEAVEMKTVWFNQMNEERMVKEKMISELQAEQRNIYDLIKIKV